MLQWSKLADEGGIMKRIFVIFVNMIIMAAILSFVVLYSRIASAEAYQRQIEHFENTTVTMERVTENYLEGEQRICDVWARYINNKTMTMEEAKEYISASHVLGISSAHLLRLDTLTGLSTRPRQGTTDDYAVSYERVDLLGDAGWIDEIGKSINITRAYTNPMNGEQSLAFCNKISLYDQGSKSFVDAVLLRVIPISELEKKWVFPQTELENAELSMIDANGDYILKGYSYKNSSFFEFYKSYNQTDTESSAKLFDRITSSTGSVSMQNSHGQECVLAFTPVAATAGWTLLGLVPAEDLNKDTENWLLFGVVSVGLLVLFLSDVFYVLYLNKRLQISAREAESANKAKTDFLSTMSHDIRTPMNAIIGLTTIAEKNLGDTESTRESLRKISLASNHLLTLINDILDISKVESGKLKMSPLTFSLLEMVENLVNMSQPMIKEKQIEFQFRVEQMEKEWLYADQLRLNQIYINILSNAIKYTEPGGSVNVLMREEQSEKPDCIRLTYVVADTGIGMSQEYMTNMYQPFSRQIDSRVNSIQGTGLGLAITKQMVDLFGGTIECQSEQDKGTTFTVVLDLSVADRQRDEKRPKTFDVLIVGDDQIMLQAEGEGDTPLRYKIQELVGEGATSTEPEDDHSDLRGMRVLVAEDIDINWEIVSNMLQMYGIESERAENGRVCVDMMSKAEEGKYDLIFMDVQMPEMNGLDATRAIRKLENPWAASIPIIAMTADAFSENITECMNAGMNGHIAKPIDLKLVIKEIRRIKDGATLS